ncbi:MAG: bifunctional rhamnulose-1-phosphate aldolase/short-chain dehydrogenase [candidate division FCPU426 bacterium]
MPDKNSYKHVDYSWDDALAAKMSPLERLIYRSNILGADQRITNTAGGNTSGIWKERHPLSGDEREVFWVKGSGGDLRTAKAANFASLFQDELLALQPRYLKLDPRGPKTPAEDSMVAQYPHTTFNLNPRAPSIDTPLLSFVPHAHVDHLHPNAIIALAASKDGEALCKEVFGEEVAWIPWQRPGFELGLRLQEACKRYPKARGFILAQHGNVSWADDDKACYIWTLDMIEKAAKFLAARDKGEQAFGGRKYADLDADKREAGLAELLPWLRGRLSRNKRVVATVDSHPALMQFIQSQDAPRLSELGTSCPDHFLRTKIKPLYVAWDHSEGMDALKSKLEKGLEAYRKDYAAYYQACKRPDSPAMRDPNPTVILIPGLGMIAWGKNKSESRVTAEFYGCAVQVMRGAEAVSQYQALPAQEAFDVEYWLLEEAKLKRMPPEHPPAREIAVVIGAGSGIGRALALRFAKEGAQVACVDIRQEAAATTAAELAAMQGEGLGVAGTGISACGGSVALACDITDRLSVRAMLRQVLLAYGGVDQIAITAGIFPSPDANGVVADPMWDKSFAVNVKGAYLVADEARALFLAQDLRASMLLTTSVNAVASKKGSLAYDTSKAAANHLVRELAVELAPLVRVNGLAPATVIQDSTMFPRDRVIASLKKYDLAAEESSSTEELRNRLADFYAKRTLTRSAITPQDQAEAAYFLLSSASSKTTGQILNVDGGLPEAFLR